MQPDELLLEAGLLPASPAGLQRRAKRGGGWMAEERGWGLAKESTWRIVFGENKPEFGELQAQGYRHKDS